MEDIQSKTCTYCKQEKPISEYYWCKSNNCHYARCKACHYELNQKNVKKCLLKKYREDPEYRRKAIEKATAAINRKISTEEGRKAHNDYCLEYYHAHKDEIIARRKVLKEEKRRQELKERLSRLRPDSGAPKEEPSSE